MQDPTTREAPAENRTLQALIASARDVLAASDDGAPTTHSFLSGWPAELALVRSVAPRSLPVLRWIDVLAPLTVPSTRDFVAMFVSAAPSLHWSQTYAAEDFGASFLE